MNNLLKYMLIAGVTLGVVSCEREPLMSGGSEGAVNFSIDYSTTTASRADDQSDFTPEKLKVRIYRPEGTDDQVLIRRYTSMEEIPTPLYLVAGEYSVLVEAGDKSNAAFVEEDEDARRLKLCYEGRKDFTVAPKSNTDIDVVCPTINVRANLLFDTADSQKDATGRRIHENRMISDVKIMVAALTTDAANVADLTAAITEAEAPMLTFTQFEKTVDANGLATASGYFLLPEGVETLVWAFEGTHETDGRIARVGTISDVKPAHAYKTSFYYTRTPDGYAAVQVEIDDDTENFEDDWYFKPQPEITGSGIDAAGVNTYTEGSDVVLTCESINDLVTLSLGGVEFFKDGAVVANAITGVSCEKDEVTKVTITLSEAYFDTLNGGVQTLSFGMQDAGSDEVYGQQLQFFKQGLVIDETAADFWLNTATFYAYITENVSKVQMRYRASGETVWNVVDAANVGSTATHQLYAGNSVTGWIEEQNSKGYTQYAPDKTKSIFPANSYEVQLLLDDQPHGQITTYVAPSVDQPINDFSFENSGLSCWSQNNSDASFWGSGNNSFKKELCTQGSRAGQLGSACAKLKASETLGMLAAGNLFTGQFDFDLASTSGTVSFGVKYNWVARPTAIKVRVWHNIGAVTTSTHAHDATIPIDSPDQASIQAVVIDWHSQHQVTSGSGAPTGVWSPENGPDASPSSGKVIGYGVVYPEGTTSGDSMVEMVIPIKYYDTVTKPVGNYTLIISSATSRYGDYMNGCKNNEMYIDGFEWVY